MDITDSMIRGMMERRSRARRRMAEYPEGDGRMWAIIEGAFAVWCVGVIVYLVVRMFF